MTEPITIRAFRAIDEPETCQKFYQGHVNVLRNYGIKPVNSSKKQWFSNPGVYGLIAESEGKALGGVKIHKAHSNIPLPIEDSIGQIDQKIFSIVDHYQKNGVGESCGLWNSKEITGRGLSYILMRSMIAISSSIKVNRLFSLSSDHTITMCKQLGYRVIHSIGQNGNFIYPTPDYIARVVLLNTKTLSWASPYNKAIMLSLREKPVQTRKEHGPKGELKIYYQLNSLKKDQCVIS